VTLLFVYGTLRKGEEADYLLNEAKFLGPTKTASGYELIPYQKDYTALITGKGKVAGELYEVSDKLLSALDNYEDDIYMRTSIKLEDGTRAEAYMMAPYKRVKVCASIYCKFSLDF